MSELRSFDWWPVFRICCMMCLILQHTTGWAQQTTGSDLTNPEGEPEPSLEYELAFDIGLSGIENQDGDRERFFATAFMPEFFYGPYSGGLLLKMHLSTKNGSTRSEDYDSFNDVLSIIRYFQYAEKYDPGYYVRFGELEEATLGFGQFINLFHNSISLDEQKRGFEFNYRAEQYVFEAIYSNLLAPEVFGLRGAYYPLIDNPFVSYNEISVGLSLAGDLSDKGTLINDEMPGAPFLVDTLTDSLGLQTAVGEDDGRLFMGGVDVSLPVFVTPTSSFLSYAELSKIFGHGAGFGVGIKGMWELPDDHRLEAQLEQRILGKHYIPNYFSSIYEAARLQTIGIPVEGQEEDVEALNTLRNGLEAQTKSRLGSYISMGWRWNRMVRVRWSLESSWNQTDDAWLHVDMRIKSPELPVYFRLRFDRLKTSSLEDLAVSGNNLNFFRLESAVKVIDFLMLGFGFRNSFEPDFQEGIPIGLKKRQRIEPKFIIVL